MNDTDLKEIKKTLTLKNVCLDKFTVCYIGNEKEIISQKDMFFTGMQQEEQLKYMDLFKKSLSGKFSKNLYSLPFHKDGDEAREELMDAVSTELDDESRDTLLKRIINGLTMAGRYAILLAYGAYDIPKKATDGTVLEGSEDVYGFILSAVCPVDLVKEGLVYNEDTNSFEEKFDDWGIEKPMLGFLYPAFTDRQEDTSQVLYYTKSDKERNEEFAERVLGIEVNKTEEELQNDFQTIVQATFDRDCDFDTVRTVTDMIKENLYVADSQGESYTLDKPELRTLIKRAGADDAALDRFENAYDEVLGTKDKIEAKSVVDKKKVSIKSDDLKMDIKSESSDLIETRMIDGREYILVPITNNITLNGVSIVETRKK